MNKILFTGLALALFLSAGQALALQPDISVPTRPIESAVTFNVNDTSNATFAGKAAGGSGVYHRILEIGVSALDAGNYTAKCGTTAFLGPIYLPANGQIIVKYEDVVKKCGDNEALNLTKDTAGNDVTFFGKTRPE